MTFVREIREELGLSQSEFARRLKTTRQRIYMRETDAKMLGLDLVYKLYEISGDTPEKFLERIKRQARKGRRG